MRRLLAWLRSRTGEPQRSGTDRPAAALAERLAADQYGFDRIDEQPYHFYTEARPAIKRLKREHRHREAEELLLWCLDFAEAETAAKGAAEPPYTYYRHLAIIYRKECRYDEEVDVLQRYCTVCARHDGEPTERVSDRLERARELAGE